MRKRAGSNPETAPHADPTTTWRLSTAVAASKHNCASAMTPPAIGSLWICWPTTVTGRKIRSRWRSRPAAACWLPVCTPPGVPSAPSTRSPQLAPRTPHRPPAQIRRRRRRRPGQHLAYRRPRAQTASREYGTCISDHGVGTRAAGRGMESSASREPAAFAPAGVLPGRPAGVPASGQRWACSRRRTRDSGHCAHTVGCCQAHP